MAPEIMQKKLYDNKVDYWSIGFLLYQLFEDPEIFAQKFENNSELAYNNITKGLFNFHAKSWDNIPTEAKNLIRKLLTVDPAQRLTGAEVKKHSWFVGRTSESIIQEECPSKLNTDNSPYSPFRGRLTKMDQLSGLNTMYLEEDEEFKRVVEPHEKNQKS